LKVLIIDDDLSALEVAKARLSKEGLDIVCAQGGVKGLKAARTEEPDLILLDLDMPDLSGFDVCRSLKSDSELCMIPVLFLSSSTTAEDKIAGLDLGAVDYVTKPFDAFELRARVRAALRTKHLQDMLFEHAHIDPLTGLPNRRALMERLHQEWSRIERHGGRMSFIMADVDNFKKVNDRYGHSVGDKLLQEVAGAIIGQCRETDLPARYGGDEFAIIVPGEMAPAAIHLADRCRREIAKACVAVHNEMVGAMASFGVADVKGISTPEELMKRADEALYCAKAAGRNQVHAIGVHGDPVGPLTGAPVDVNPCNSTESPSSIN
jgi:two-component system, cell cycle response regulator